MTTEQAPRRTPPVVVTPPTGWDLSSWQGLVDIVREDMASHARGWLVPAKHMLAVHRFGEWVHAPQRGLIVGRLGRIAYKLVNAAYVRNVLGFEVSHDTAIGRHVVFVHQNGVVLQPGAVIGDDCMIYHGVTLGRRWEPDHAEAYYQPPRIGRGVHLGVGSVVIGAVSVGDGAKVGPNAVVVTDVPEGGSVVSPPARSLRLR